MKKIASVALAVLAVSLFAGCAGVDAADSATAESVTADKVGGSVPAAPAVDAAVGSYSIDKAALAEAMKAAMPAGASGQGPPGEGAGIEAAAKMMKQVLDGMDGSMELKADHTCALTMTMMGQTQEVSGVWSREGDQLSITVQQEGEVDDTRVVVFVDDVITVTEDQGGESMSFNYVRSAK